MGVEDTWKAMRTRMEDALTKHVPLKKKRKDGPKWMNNDIKRMIQRKRKTWDKWKRTKGMNEKKEYEEMERKTKRMIRNKKNKVVRKVAREAKTNPRNFYFYVSGAQQTRSKIGPIIDENGAVIADLKRQANVFNDFYASVFTRLTEPGPAKESITGKVLDDVEISCEIIERIIDGRNEKSAAGPDKIPNKIIIECKKELTTPLRILFRSHSRRVEVSQCHTHP